VPHTPVTPNPHHALRRAARARLLLVATPVVLAAAALAACKDDYGTTPLLGRTIPVSRIIITPDVDTILVRNPLNIVEAIRLTPFVIGFSGTVLTAPPPVRWTTADPQVVTVDSTGLVRPLRLGTAAVTAHSGDKEASVRIVVLRAPTTPGAP
jgi:Bacterial Ig-like domain (group 2)